MFEKMVLVDALVLDEQIIKATYPNGNVVKEDMKNYNIMQSSGLKDKNGKEIFAGDILKVTNKEHWFEIVFYNEEKAMFVTKEIRKGFNVPESPLYNLFDTSLFAIEVVGNIYENPELLKAK